MVQSAKRQAQSLQLQAKNAFDASSKALEQADATTDEIEKLLLTLQAGVEAEKAQALSQVAKQIAKRR